MNIKFAILYPNFIASRFYDCIFLIFNLLSQIAEEKKIKTLTAETNSQPHKTNTKSNSLPTCAFPDSLDPDQARQMPGLIWVLTVWHSEGTPEQSFWKGWFKKISWQQILSMQNYPEGKKLTQKKMLCEDVYDNCHRHIFTILVYAMCHVHLHILLCIVKTWRPHLYGDSSIERKCSSIQRRKCHYNSAYITGLDKQKFPA